MTTTTTLRTTEIFAADGFAADGARRGGYFIDTHATYGGGGRVGALDDAYVALPIAGKCGQLSLLLGQATPLLYQADPINFLTDTAPAPLAAASGDCAPAQPTPPIRMGYFARRSADSADGNYLSVSVPFAGALALNRTARLGKFGRIFAHAFHREGYAMIGLMRFQHGRNSLTGLVGSYAWGEATSLR